MRVTLWDQLMLDVRSSSLCRWFYEILVTWTVEKIVKNYAFFILLFGLLGMAKSITFTLTQQEDGFAGLKYVTFPRRAGLFFFCTQVQGTPKRPVEIFIVDIQLQDPYIGRVPKKRWRCRQRRPLAGSTTNRKWNKKRSWHPERAIKQISHRRRWARDNRRSTT